MACRHHVLPHKRLASNCCPCAQVKSYLTGNPPIAIALNDGLVIGRREGGGPSEFGYGRASEIVQLDDCNFHEVCACMPSMPLYVNHKRLCAALGVLVGLCTALPSFVWAGHASLIDLT